eukprot:Rhum_TRINITY_DN19044_c0_g2::Rhum_TRINITY_DN19044_c0_g2_i1::g.169070::m.169070
MTEGRLRRRRNGKEGGVREKLKPRREPRLELPPSPSPSPPPPPPPCEADADADTPTTPPHPVESGDAAAAASAEQGASPARSCLAHQRQGGETGGMRRVRTACVPAFTSLESVLSSTANQSSEDEGSLGHSLFSQSGADGYSVHSTPHAAGTLEAFRFADETEGESEGGDRSPQPAPANAPQGPKNARGSLVSFARSPLESALLQPLKRAAMRTQSEYQLRRSNSFFTHEYSERAERLLATRNNSHFLPSRRQRRESEELEERAAAGTHRRRRAWKQACRGLETLLSAAVVYTSFSNIALITHWNPYVKVVQFGGRALFPVLDEWVGVAAADRSLWVGSMLGYFRALGRMSGTYRKLSERHVGVAMEGTSPVEQVLAQLHWVFDLLYFPTEHLALFEWETLQVLGAHQRLFFMYVNAVVWYWRQVTMVALLAYAICCNTLALPVGAQMLYVTSMVMDLLCAYSFMPHKTAAVEATPAAAKRLACLYSRNLTFGLGMTGCFGVAEGLCQITLRWCYA